MSTLELIVIGVVAGLCFGGGAIFMTLRFYNEKFEDLDRGTDHQVSLHPHENFVDDNEVTLAEEKRSA